MRSPMEHVFSELPNIDTPRSKFNRSFDYMTTFNFGDIIPLMAEEYYPADSLNLNINAFARLSTMIKPVMTNMYIDIHVFRCRNYQVFANWRRLMGERDPDPDSSIDYQVPTIDINGETTGSLSDYFGLPINTSTTCPVNSLPFRHYANVWKHWYRDENLQDSPVVDTDDGPDNVSDYPILKRGKRKDYFTSALPWPQKGDAIQLPLGSTAPIYGTNQDTYVYNASDSTLRPLRNQAGDGHVFTQSFPSADGNIRFSSSATDVGLLADLSSATAATINDIREAFQLQKVLERDALAGSRYNELIKGHFGVEFYDVAVRPEYLGGGTITLNVNPVAQQSYGNVASSETPQGNLSAFGTGAGYDIGCVASFNDFGYVLVLASARSDLLYQQGIDRKWLRTTRETFYFPSYAHLGEQEITNKEIYWSGDANDDLVFGYQERYAELRYGISKVTGLFRSGATGTIDVWHLAQDFSSLPALNDAFIQESPPINRIKAVTSEPDLIMHCGINAIWARPMPLYSIPGFIDHF